MSKPTAFTAPMAACTSMAAAGNARSPDEVASTIRSISFGSIPASDTALFAASTARAQVPISFDTLLSQIPVLSRIHASSVSRNSMRSLFVTTVSGTYEPIPMIFVVMSDSRFSV